MTIYVVTDSAHARAAFRPAERSRTYSVTYVASREYRSALKSFSDESEAFLYFDATDLDQSALVRRVRSLVDRRPYGFGVLDPHGQVEDVAQLFHLGAADYLGKKLLEAGLATARLKRVVDYAPELDRKAATGDDLAVARQEWIPSGSDWSRIEQGTEYTFLMVYAGIDHAGDLRRKTSEVLLRNMRVSFQSVLERNFRPYGGQIWMWKEDDGLLLVPFDGRSVDPVIPAIRLILNEVLINVDEFSAFEPLTWRLALHLVNSTYKRQGQTGAIVSEDVNYVFHLGGRFLDAGELAVTGECYGLLPQKVRGLFEPRGRFEGIEVYTLRETL